MTSPMPHADKPSADPPALAPAAVQESFVINLCSSTTPMALTQPQLVELKRFKFFVSRRLEDGRERFRLHMGYFDSLLQAEELLPVVRDIYPGAWAGEAPGKRLRGRGEPPVVQAAPPMPGPLPVAIAVAASAALPDATIIANAPTLNFEPAAPVAAIPTITAVDVTIATAPPVVSPAPAFELELVADAPPASASEPEPEPVEVLPAAPVATVPPVPKAAHVAAVRSAGKTTTRTFRRDANVPFDQRSNVREVLKSLDETGRAAPAVTTPVVPASQVLRLHEEKLGDPLNTVSTPAAFAIQLQWSVQAIDLSKVPALAIFGAYTLYTVEGSREGRKWFGLRLGFFSDANAAKTVAQYVRSEFSSVAVVPVSLRERDGAHSAQGGAKSSSAEAAPTPALATTERIPDQSAEFRLLDDTAERPKLSPELVAAATQAAKPKGPPGKRAVPGRPRTVKPRGNRVQANEKRGPKTFEETLEILGADQLQVEGAKKKVVSDNPVRHLDVKVQKNSAFSRLLDRLVERKV